jgi:hypothetical protein
MLLIAADRYGITALCICRGLKRSPETHCIGFKAKKSVRSDSWPTIMGQVDPSPAEGQKTSHCDIAHSNYDSTLRRRHRNSRIDRSGLPWETPLGGDCFCGDVIEQTGHQPKCSVNRENRWASDRHSLFWRERDVIFDARPVAESVGEGTFSDSSPESEYIGKSVALPWYQKSEELALVRRYVIVLQKLLFDSQNKRCIDM